MTRQNKAKILLIGLDGGTLDVIRPLVNQGRLPNIANLMKSGSYGSLQSGFFPQTYPAWSSFMTGKNPGKHGIFNFYEPTSNYKISCLNATHRNGVSLWKILSDNGKRVGILNMPATYFPERINGFLISGLGTPGVNSNFTYPGNLRSDLLNEFEEYSLLDIDPGGRNKEQFINRLIKITCDTTEISKYLLKRYDLDFFAVVFQTTDIVQHFFWHCMDTNHPLFTKEENEKYGDAVFKIYEQIDRGIGELINCFSEKPTVIIMSDHGFGPTKKIIYLNRWLIENNYLKLKSIKKDVFQKLLSKITKKFGLMLTVEWKSRIERLIPQIRERIKSRLFFANIDWENTKAFVVGPVPYVYINKKGAWEHGIVEDSQEYVNIIEELRDKLKKLKDPKSGESVMQEVYTKEKIYKGKYLDKAPDLILQPKDYAYKINPGFESWSSPIIEDIPENHHNSKPIRLSGHKLNGVIIISGKNIKNKSIDGARIIDVSPTILYLMNLSIPKDMDGKVLDIFRPDYIRKNPVRYRDGILKDNGKIIGDYEDSEEEKIKKSLQRLGYL